MIKGSRHKPQTIKKMREKKLGKKASLITKLRMSESHKGEKNGFYKKKHKPESKLKMSQNSSGENCSPETRRKLSESRKRTKASLETRRKQSERSKGEKNNFYKKKHKPESKLKMAEYRKGRKMRLQTKLKIAESLKGEKCHLWRGGISFEKYGLEFNNILREQIRARDNYCCQQCATPQSELFTKSGRPTKLSIHHCDYNKKNNSPLNLISLCTKCHCKTNLNRKHWTKHFQIKILIIQQKLFYKNIEERIKKQNIKVIAIDECRAGMSYGSMRIAEQMNKMLKEGTLGGDKNGKTRMEL